MGDGHEAPPQKVPYQQAFASMFAFRKWSAGSIPAGVAVAMCHCDDNKNNFTEVNR